MGQYSIGADRQAQDAPSTSSGRTDEGNILIQDSDVKAANTTTLTADNQINLLAAKNESSLNSTNSSSSGSVSVSWGAGGWGGGASAARGKGKSDGGDTSFSNTNVTAGNTAPILDLRTPLSLTDDDCVLIGKFVATASLISGAAN